MVGFKVRRLSDSGLGSRLKERRLEKAWSLKKCSLKSSIPIKYLEALESDDWEKLPGEIYLKNFLKKYCEILGLNSSLYSDRYEKQKDPVKKIKRKKIGFENIKEYLIKNITPRKLRIILGIFLVFMFSIYIFSRINNYLQSPELEILEPGENIVTEKNLITIKGKTEKEALVDINGEEIGVGENGDFSIDVKLKYGLNRFNIITRRKHGRPNKKEIIIIKKKDYIEGSF